GATDYPTTSVDFGKAREYQPRSTLDAAGLSYYPPSNTTVPACGATTATVTVQNLFGPEGNVSFLNQWITGTSAVAFPGLSLGNYSIFAQAAAGLTFVRWIANGSVSVANPGDASTNLWVAGSGGVLAVFGPANSTTGVFANITFASPTTGATFSVVTGAASDRFGVGHDPRTWDVTAGTTLQLLPGLYAIQGQPPAGHDFAGWSATSGVRVAADGLPDTILDVPVGANATLTAHYTTSTTVAFVDLFSDGLNGSFVLNGTTYPLLGVASLPVGSYDLGFVPSPGSHFLTWSVGGSAMMTNFSQSTRVTFEAGSSGIVAVGYSSVLVRLQDSGGHGEIAWNTLQNLSAVSVPSGTTVDENVTGFGFVGMTASASPGWVFRNWSVNNTSAAAVIPNASSPFVALVVNTSHGVSAVTVTANFAALASVSLAYSVTPVSGGFVDFGFNATYRSTGVASLPPGGAGTFAVAIPSPGYVVSGATAQNATLHLASSAGPGTRPWARWEWVVTNLSANASLIVTFSPLLYPVTFVADSPTSIVGGFVNGSLLGSGDTVWLRNGTYPVSAVVASGATFLKWTPSSPGLRVASPGSNGTNLTVLGPGTVYALVTGGTVAPVVSASISPGPATLLPGAAANFSVTASCAGNTTCAPGTIYTWSLSNPTAGSLNRSSGANVRFTAAVVYASTDLVVDASLGGAMVRSTPVLVAVVPALVGAQVSPPSTSVYDGQGVVLGAVLTCMANLTCPSGGAFVWSLASPALGSVAPLGANGSSPSTARFTASQDVAGVENLTLSVDLNSVRINATAQVSVVRPLLTAVSIRPVSVTARAGSLVNLSAAGTCTLDLLCPSLPDFAWTLSSPSLGSLSMGGGSQVQFTAGTLNVSGWLNVTGTLNGVTIDAPAVRVVVETSPSVLTSVQVTPSLATLTVGATEAFSATLTCTPSPCPAGATVVWAVVPAVGTLSTTSGDSTILTATLVGTATVYANATLGGTTVSGSASPVAVGPSGTLGSTSTPFYDNPLLWAAIVVVGVVVIAAALLWRRGSSGGSAAHNAPGPSESARR
ncbi:MAG: hypothetical protein L3K05_04660, partial [Thermoplasmata archaeon]|nr:hypothetical protein [Thermoplasmata archaeon]